jgi:hypothetical protein
LAFGQRMIHHNGRSPVELGAYVGRPVRRLAELVPLDGFDGHTAEQANPRYRQKTIDLNVPSRPGADSLIRYSIGVIRIEERNVRSGQRLNWRLFPPSTPA